MIASTVRTPTAQALLDSRLVAGPDALAPVRSSITGHDRGETQRALDVRVAGGIDLRLLPDRGLDIVGAWYAGLPLHWSSQTGERRSRDDFLAGFSGGLLLTCGLDNVGPTSEGRPTHGTFTRLPAHDVTWSHTVDRGEIVVTVVGTIDDSDALARFLRCERTITTRTALTSRIGEVTVTDTVTNLAAHTAVAPMLYHVNLGAPLWQPGSTVDITAAATCPRDADAAAHPDWSSAPRPVPGGAERVYEHDRPDSRVSVRGPGLRVDLSWSVATMPRLHQWIHPGASSYVLGVEPANCSVLGRGSDRAFNRLPTLAAGASRTTSFRLTARPDADPVPTGPG